MSISDPGDLPPGLGFDGSSGLISGTPSETGTFAVMASAINAGGTDTETLTLNVLPPAPVFAAGLTATGTNGSVFNYQIVGSNNPTGYGATGLPPGLGVDASTGVISGTPTAGGVFPVTMSASNAGGTGTGGLLLTVISQVAKLKGTYVGLASLGGTNEALFTIAITAKGAFTGKLTGPGTNYRIKGTLTAYGTYTGFTLGSVPQSVQLNVNAVVPQFSGSISNATSGGNRTYLVESSQSGIFKPGALPAGMVGKYTAMLPGLSGTDPTVPHASGYGTMIISKKGAIHIAGKLGDGTPFATGAQLNADKKTWTLFELLYAKKAQGTIAGTITAEALAGSDWDGEIDWIKPPQAVGNYYRGGFAAGAELMAAIYAGASLTTGTGIEIGGGDLPAGDITDALTISAKDKVVVSGTDGGVALTLTLGTGLFKGTFLNPVNGDAKTGFGGVIYEKPVGEGIGLFLGPDQSGSVEIVPADQAK